MNVDYEKLAKIRKRKRITQKQLAEKINMSVSSIKAYETGRLSPSVSALEDICSVLGISASSVSDIGDFRVPDFDRDAAMHSFLFASLSTNTPDLSTREGNIENYVDIDGEMLSKEEYAELLEEMKSGTDYIKNRYMQLVKKHRSSRPASEFYYKDASQE